MKRRRRLFLMLLMLQGAASGCHVATTAPQFSEVPDYAPSQAKLRKASADLEIIGARPGVERTSLAQGIRKALGPASNIYPEQEKMGDAKKLADRVLAGDKVTLHLPADMANEMAHSLAEAGLIVKLAE
jgi:hypothetical protein